MFRSLFLILGGVFPLLFAFANSHSESGEWKCDSSHSGAKLVADFRPGVVTLDGHHDDWKDVDGHEFSLLLALDPHQDHAYKGGKMTVKALHDGTDAFFLLQIDGEYAYTKEDYKKCPSVALMFQIGENATYHNMGGCKESPDSCTRQTCRGHEVDIVHFQLGTAIPGRLYGGNLYDYGTGYDRFGHLDDGYSWNPHCQFLDGVRPKGHNNTGQNDWKGAWWHSSLNTHTHGGFVDDDSPFASNGGKGTYYFEFSRPLRTMDCFQQDAQFKIGETRNFSVAFWYPEDGKPWQRSGHYTVSCDWSQLDFTTAASLTKAAPAGGSWNGGIVFSLLLSIMAFCLSVYMGYRVSTLKGVAFSPVDNHL